MILLLACVQVFILLTCIASAAAVVAVYALTGGKEWSMLFNLGLMYWWVALAARDLPTALSTIHEELTCLFK